MSHLNIDHFNIVLTEVKKDLNRWSVLDAGFHGHVSYKNEYTSTNQFHSFLRILTLCVGILFGMGNLPGSAFPLSLVPKFLVDSVYPIINIIIVLQINFGE